jgi:hypothetical protein
VFQAAGQLLGTCEASIILYFLLLSCTLAPRVALLCPLDVGAPAVLGGGSTAEDGRLQAALLGVIRATVCPQTSYFASLCLNLLIHGNRMTILSF